MSSHLTLPRSSAMILVLAGAAAVLAMALVLVIALEARVARAGVAVAGADLTITKTTDVDHVAIDGEIQYTIQVTNGGTATAWHVRVRDPNIDPELDIREETLTASRGSCFFTAGDNLRCLVNRLLPGQSVTVRFTAIAPIEACPFVRNQARTFADNEPSANLGDNQTPKVTVDIDECPPDTTPPTGSVTINRGAANAWGPKVLLGLTATDNRTGSSSMRMRISNSPDLDGQGRLQHAVEQFLVSTRQWSLVNPTFGGTATLGFKTVYVQFGDRAGNWSSVSSDQIRMRADAANTCTAARLQTPRAFNVNYFEQIFPRADDDVFKFRLKSRATVRISLSSLPLNYGLALFNKDCERIAFSGNSGTTSEVIKRTLSRGTYFARVGAPLRLYSIDTYVLRIGKP